MSPSRPSRVETIDEVIDFAPQIQKVSRDGKGPGPASPRRAGQVRNLAMSTLDANGSDGNVLPSQEEVVARMKDCVPFRITSILRPRPTIGGGAVATPYPPVERSRRR